MDWTVATGEGLAWKTPSEPFILYSVFDVNAIKWLSPTRCLISFTSLSARAWVIASDAIKGLEILKLLEVASCEAQSVWGLLLLPA